MGWLGLENAGPLNDPSASSQALSTEQPLNLDSAVLDFPGFLIGASGAGKKTRRRSVETKCKQSELSPFVLLERPRKQIGRWRRGHADPAAERQRSEAATTRRGTVDVRRGLDR